MIITITGGSCSGKSALGETIAHRLEPGEKYYIATMAKGGAEAANRIARHRELRRGKNFITLEQPSNLAAVQIAPNATVLLECVSNLLANEMFPADGNPLTERENLPDLIINDITNLAAACKHLVIITNEVFSDGLPYDPDTIDYIAKLGAINRRLFQLSGVCIESVYSIPVFHKGALPWQL